MSDFAVTTQIALVRPEVILIVGGTLLFLAGAFLSHRWSRDAVAGVALALLLIAPLALGPDAPAPSSQSLFRLDPLARYVLWLSIGAGLLLVLLGRRQVVAERAFEYYACLLLIIAGVALVGAANDLATLFLALELVSIPTYVLLYLPARGAASQEAVTKYFLLSVFASAIFLYGICFLYGLVGSTNFEVIAGALARAGSRPLPLVLLLSLGMVVAGLAFRVTAVPFHFYAPDVFQGSSLAGGALLSILPKIAGLGALIRVAYGLFLVPGIGFRSWSLIPEVTTLFAVLAVLSMFVGNLLALLQGNLKRLFAYSSIAHGGYMLVGLAAGRSALAGVSDPIDGIEATLYYLVIYGAMTLGAFAIFSSLSVDSQRVETLADLRGLSQAAPGRALCLALFCLSLTGLPPTAGFWGKFNLFLAAWSQGSPLLHALAILLALNAAIGGWVYLRIIGSMYLVPAGSDGRVASDRWATSAAVACALVVIWLFVAPGPLLRWVEISAR